MGTWPPGGGSTEEGERAPRSAVLKKRSSKDRKRVYVFTLRTRSRLEET